MKWHVAYGPLAFGSLYGLWQALPAIERTLVSEPLAIERTLVSERYAARTDRSIDQR